MVLVSSGYVIDIIAGEKITIIIMGYLVWECQPWCSGKVAPSWPRGIMGLKQGKPLCMGG